MLYQINWSANTARIAIGTIYLSKKAMEIISEAKTYCGKEKQTVSKGAPKALRKEIKEQNLAVERAAIIMQDLNKFSGDAGRARLAQARLDFANGLLYVYEDAARELKVARALPKGTEQEKEIRSDAIKCARTKKESASIIIRYGVDNIKAPDDSVKEELQNRETSGFFESLEVKRQLKAYLKSVSVYERAVKPYTNAKNLIEQAENYTHYDELEQRYYELKMQ